MTHVLEPCFRLTLPTAPSIGRPERPGASTPGELSVLGSPDLLHLPLLAIFSSVAVPGEAVLSALDLARRLRDDGVPVIAGFQTPIEQEVLRFLLRGSQPVVIALAREISGMRVPRSWRPALAEGRLLVISGARKGRRRVSAQLASERNRLVCALATRILVLHAAPGGRVHRLATEALDEEKPVFCLDTPANSDLLILGARAVAPTHAPIPNGRDTDSVPRP